MDIKCEHEWYVDESAQHWFTTARSLILFCKNCDETKTVRREYGSAVVHNGFSARIPTGVVTR